MNDLATVFVVDPDAATRDAVRELAHLMSLRCETFASGDAFLKACDGSQPGCVVLEVRIPGVSGMEIQAHLAARFAHLTTVFLTAHATVSMAVWAMRAGAVHFLEKPFREHELWDTLQEAISLSRKRWETWRETHELRRLLAQLTAKERQILQLIGEGRPKKAIAAELNVCVRTVEIRRSQLMDKLGVSNPAELIHFAIKAGANGEARFDLPAALG